MSDNVIDVLLVDDNAEQLDEHLTATRPRLILMDVQIALQQADETSRRA